MQWFPASRSEGGGISPLWVVCTWQCLRFKLVMPKPPLHVHSPRICKLQSLRRRYAVDYNALFCGTIRRALEEVDPRVLYLDSSPSNGLVCADPYVKR